MPLDTTNINLHPYGGTAPIKGGKMSSYISLSNVRSHGPLPATGSNENQTQSPRG